MTKKTKAPEPAIYPAAVMPYLVLDSAQFRGLSSTAKALLLDTLRMHDGYNNGRLSISQATRVRKDGLTLRERGWTSRDVLYRARDELLSSGLLVRTRRGGRNMGCDLFALAWMPISNDRGLDVKSADRFDLRWQTINSPRIEARAQGSACPVPSGGKGNPGWRDRAIPAGGTESSEAIPADGTIGRPSTLQTIPAAGNHVNVAMCSEANATREANGESEAAPNPRRACAR